MNKEILEITKNFHDMYEKLASEYNYETREPIFKSGKDVEFTNNKTQQKEFINFLEDNYKETQDIWYIKILQKYKSIIGVSDDKTN